MSVIDVDNLGIRYAIRYERARTIKEVVMNKLRGRGGAKEFWALRNVTFRVDQGEILGIVGPNGAGKSTLCLSLCQILHPDEGTVDVHGSVSTLLTLGTGFNRALSGRDNIYLNGAFLGFTKKQIDAMVDDIVEFADLGEFIHAPVKTYSSGMMARLGFAIAVRIEPEILIIDEVLGVGDEAFKDKCQAKLQELIGRAKAIIIVSHAARFIQAFATRVMWLNEGRVEALGDPDEVVNAYMKWANARKAKRTVKLDDSFRAAMEAASQSPDATMDSGGVSSGMDGGMDML
jgi:ABC-type polysaccharide/polyol phosphate transport system ATPase subunit